MSPARQRHRFRMATVDLAIARLERLNLSGRGGGAPLDPTTARVIARSLTAIPEDARRRFAGPGTVQAALDGLFDVQAALIDRYLDELGEEWDTWPVR